MLIFDAHSDMLVDISARRITGERNVFLNRHYPKFVKGGVNALIAVVWLDPINYVNSSASMLQILKNAYAELYPLENIVFPVRNVSELDDAVKNNKMAVILGMEGLEGLEEDPEGLYFLYELGLRHASLTWNYENFFASGVKSDKGLTAAGKKVVKIMDELGIIIDVSHANEKTFWDIIDIASGPIIASHSNAYSLCDAARNLKDNQIKAIAEKGGLIGINAWHDFIDNKNPTVGKLADHVDYMVDMVGVDHLAFGFDFCDYLEDDTVAAFQTGEPGTTKGLENSGQIPNFIKELKIRGYNSEELEKMGFLNLRNLFAQVTKINKK